MDFLNGLDSTGVGSFPLNSTFGLIIETMTNKLSWSHLGFILVLKSNLGTALSWFYLGFKK